MRKKVTIKGVERLIKDPAVGLIINKREKNERKALSEDEIEKINEFCKISDCGPFVIILTEECKLKGGKIIKLTILSPQLAFF